MRLGLRAQIVLALSLVFLLAVWSLGFVTLQITRRSAEVALLRSEHSLARELVVVLEHGSFTADSGFLALCTALHARSGLARLRVAWGDGRVETCGQLEGTRATEATFAGGGRLQLAMTPTRDPSSSA